MFRIASPRKRFGLTAGLLIAAGILGVGVTVSRPTVAADANSKLKQLQQEKLQLLRLLREQIDKLHQEGEEGSEDLYEAQLAENRAELDLCENDQEKIAVTEKMLDNAKQREQAMQEVEGAVARRKIHKAHVNRLDVEISLEKLRSKK